MRGPKSSRTVSGKTTRSNLKVNGPSEILLPFWTRPHYPVWQMTCDWPIINAKTDKSRVFCPHSSMRSHNWVHNESYRSKNRLAGPYSNPDRVLEAGNPCKGWTNIYRTTGVRSCSPEHKFEVTIQGSSKNRFWVKNDFLKTPRKSALKKTSRYLGFLRTNQVNFSVLKYWRD